MYDIEVISVDRASENMLRFTASRPQTFRFNSGEFAMIGIDGLFRAYSMVSTKYDDYLEFLSVRNRGEFTRKLESLQPGDTIQLRPKATGSLRPEYLFPKENLILLATGTGVAPFMSIVRDPDTYDRFNNVYLFHTVRKNNDLVYHLELVSLQADFPFTYIDTVTQEKCPRQGRFWDFLLKDFNKETDSVMVCGSPELNKTCRKMFNEKGWQEGNTGVLGDFLLERAFVD
jgi:ferredoxin--NADP+ reductase